MDEKAEFVEALATFVRRQLQDGHDATYSQRAVKVLDARNQLFRLVECARTDEAEDVFALVDLCFLDEDMQLVPDRQRIAHLARNYWG